MAFDATLAARIRRRLGKRAGLVEKQMFGGVAFLLNGNMCCGVHGEEMIVRLAPGDTEKALAQANTHRFDLTGRPMQGWILVKPQGLATGAALGKWIGIASRYAASLPPK
jgi:hypothetical protein